jgi:hypothetical protein
MLDSISKQSQELIGSLEIDPSFLLVLTKKRLHRTTLALGIKLGPLVRPRNVGDLGAVWFFTLRYLTD